MSIHARIDWKFKYKVSEVLTAARVKVRHHNSRLEYWTAETKKREKALRDKGISFRESVAGGSTSNVYRQEPDVDRTLHVNFIEAQARVKNHTDQRDTYQIWVRVLTRQIKSSSLDLTMEDVVFFGL